MNSQEDTRMTPTTRPARRGLGLLLTTLITSLLMAPAQAQQEDPIEIMKRVTKLMKEVDGALSKTAAANTLEKIQEIIDELDKLDPPPNAGAGGGGGGEADGGGEAGGGGGESSGGGDSESGGDSAGGGDSDVARPMGEAIDEIQKLLESVSGKAGQAADELQRVIEIAEQMGQGQGDGEGQPSDSSGEKQGEKQQEDIRKDDVDSLNKEKPHGGQKPENGEQAEKPYQPNGNPDDPETDEQQRERDSGSWAPHLPPKAREAVEMGALDSVPPEYRKLVETYYRMLAGERRGSMGRSGNREIAPADDGDRTSGGNQR